KETSYPVAVYKWNAYNPTEEVVEVSIMFTWQNMLGWKPVAQKDNTKVKWEKNYIKEALNTKVESGEYKGVILTAPKQGINNALEGEFCIAAQQVLGTKVYIQTIFDCDNSGEYMWLEFFEKGVLKDFPNPDIAAKGAALVVKFILGPKDSLEVPIVLTWDLPKAAGFYRYYTRFQGRQGQNSFKMAKQALIQYKSWESQIDAWQHSVLSQKRYPSWYKRLLWNELYYLADGSTIWDANSGRLAYLECYDYLFYDTLDVRYFGSFPLAYFWPEVEKNVLRGFAQTINLEDRTAVTYNQAMDMRDKRTLGKNEEDSIYNGIRKKRGACPHDLGSPFESVFNKTNAYLWQNANRWKDLNSKFILQVYRIYELSSRKDKKFLKDLWPAVIIALDYLETLDKDHDHLPENENFPDQTFDNWTMQGTSAYCGVLRVASLIAASTIAEILDDQEKARQYRIWAKIAQESLHAKLWNGKYFDFCEKNSDLMAAQLAGHWYLDLFELRPFIQKKSLKNIFKVIYQNNFKKFNQGKYGVVNGRTINNTPVKDEQGNDVWLGINFMLASHMFCHDLDANAWNILKSIHKIIYKNGFFFRTPESWDNQGNFMASMYMRAGAIWSVEYALRKRQIEKRTLSFKRSKKI
ncbi:MAG: hypothetical protein KKA19_01725, partial [Candidatus Margulisbacteria bacterium]|nr:hypothetical protein [Candidatus Margulisiibacteriota bacterium]